MLRFKSTQGTEGDVVHDVHKLLLGDTCRFVPFKKDNGSWVMDAGNNTFLRMIDENEYELSSRYGAQDKLNAIGMVLEWRGPYKVIEPKKAKAF